MQFFDLLQLLFTFLYLPVATTCPLPSTSAASGILQQLTKPGRCQDIRCFSLRKDGDQYCQRMNVGCQHCVQIFPIPPGSRERYRCQGHYKEGSGNMPVGNLTDDVSAASVLGYGSTLTSSKK